MAPSILLLDCSEELRQRLERLGYAVQTGTVGFATGERNLPAQIYESDLIIYDPKKLFDDDLNRNISESDIDDETPEFPLSLLKDHFLRGATVLVFANKLSSDISDADQDTAYNWIPYMPRMEFTKDNQVYTQQLGHTNYDHFIPLQDVNGLQKPVLLKLKTHDSKERDFEYSQSHNFSVVPMFKNANNETLGVIQKIFEGHLIVVPTFKSNDDQVVTFLGRVLKLQGPEDPSKLYDFSSPEEIKALTEELDLIKQEESLKEAIQIAKENVETQKRVKIQTIESDQTAVLIRSYYATAVQQKDVALFFLFKITEAIENKYGSEKLAKQALSAVNREWNLIGTLANQSYGDMRHAPKPGEKIKEWKEEEIKSAYEAAVKIVKAYFATLF